MNSRRPKHRDVMVRTLIQAALALVATTAIASDESQIHSALRVAGLSAEELAGTSKTVLANRDRTAVAVAVHRQQRSLVLILLRQTGGEYRAVDVSPVEEGNFGKLGFPRSRYDRFETQPVEWIARKDGLFQVVIRTRAWQSGCRYTTAEALIVRPDGTPLWR